MILKYTKCLSNSSRRHLAVSSFHPETGTLVWKTQAYSILHLSTKGLTSLVILGTNVETMLLTQEERKMLVATMRVE
jgi:4-hydroxy-2-oxoglutarate aldolase